MTVLSLPFTGSKLLSEFGISVKTLSSLAPATSTGTTLANGANYGKVPANIKSSAGATITSSTWRNLSIFAGCFYVKGCIRIQAPIALNASYDEIYNGSSATVYGIGNSVSKSGGTFTITSTAPTGATSTCTVTLTLSSAGSGSSTTYVMDKFTLSVGSGANNNGAFKIAATSSVVVDTTDTYNGWHGSNATVAVTGYTSGSYMYAVVYVRNRVV